MIIAIVAHDLNRGIGLNNDLPWDLPEDMAFFQRQTANSSIIMGRKTWESIGNKNLPGRKSVVLTSNPGKLPGDADVVTSDAYDAIRLAEMLSPSGNVFIIGGRKVYETYMKMPRMIDMYQITVINDIFPCDTFFPLLPTDTKYSTIVIKRTDKAQWLDLKCLS